MKAAALDALSTERWVLGESVYKFEEEFAQYCGAKYGVATSSGTDALYITLQALGVTKGTVITTPASFIASANVALYVNATPRFADIELQTYTLDPVEVEKTITADTSAILPVHLYGYPAAMDRINSLADKHDVKVIEDACQAHGAVFRTRKVGVLGDAACFSFYPSKNMMVAGDGGMIVTNDQRLAERAAKLRDCGRLDKYAHDIIGTTARLNTVNAAIGRVQLKYLDQWNHQRRVNAQRYQTLLADIDALTLPPQGNTEIQPVFHLYVIRTQHREALKTYLESQGIHCGIHYPIPIHLQPVYQRLYGYTEGAFPRSEALSQTCLSIPMSPLLPKEDIHYISETIHDFYTT
jgi:perosamine synthetase